MKENVFNPPAIVKVMLPMLLKLAEEIADGLVRGENLDEKGKRILVTAYVVILLWGKPVAFDTETDIDDKVVTSALELIIDTAKEAGVTLPEITL